MKKIKLLTMIMLLVLCLTLTSCAKEVTEDEFYDKLSQTEESPYKTAKVSTTSKSSKETKTENYTIDLETMKIDGEASLTGYFMTGLIKGSKLALVSVVSAIQLGGGSVTYYAGSTFKVEAKNNDQEIVMELNQYGLLTYYKTVSDDGTSTTRISYSK